MDPLWLSKDEGGQLPPQQRAIGFLLAQIGTQAEASEKAHHKNGGGQDGQKAVVMIAVHGLAKGAESYRSPPQWWGN